MPIAVAPLVVIGLLAGAPAAFAQYQGHNFKGDFGVNAGTQLVGNLLTPEGGAAYNVPAIGGAFGIGYYLFTLARLRQ